MPVSKKWIGISFDFWNWESKLEFGYGIRIELGLHFETGIKFFFKYWLLEKKSETRSSSTVNCQFQTKLPRIQTRSDFQNQNLNYYFVMNPDLNQTWGSSFLGVKLELEPFYVFFKELKPEVLHKNQELPKTVCKLPVRATKISVVYKYNLETGELYQNKFETSSKDKTQLSRVFTMVIVHYEYNPPTPLSGKWSELTKQQ